MDESMLPLIHPEDKVIVKRTKKIELDDIVVFKKGKGLVAHRVIHKNKNFFIVKGDNNYKSDGKIKPSQILGKAADIKRKGEKINLEHLYLTQSSLYLKELKSITKRFKSKKIAHIFLKGLPLHLYYFRSAPKRIYYDADILIKPKDKEKALTALKTLGFELEGGKLFGQKIKSTQLTLVKKPKPFPVIIDLHLEPALGFTKAGFLNNLIPNYKNYERFLHKNSKIVRVNKQAFPVLEENTLFVYLLLHLYHHNFQGYHRLNFIDRFAKQANLDRKRVVSQIKKFNFENFVVPSLLLLNAHYKTPITQKLVKELSKKDSYTTPSILAKFINPFNTRKQALDGIIRVVYLLILSPTSFAQKAKLVLDKRFFYFVSLTIKSFFAKS